MLRCMIFLHGICFCMLLIILSFCLMYFFLFTSLFLFFFLYFVSLFSILFLVSYFLSISSLLDLVGFRLSWTYLHFRSWLSQAHHVPHVFLLTVPLFSGWAPFALFWVPFWSVSESTSFYSVWLTQSHS